MWEKGRTVIIMELVQDGQVARDTTQEEVNSGLPEVLEGKKLRAGPGSLAMYVSFRYLLGLGHDNIACRVIGVQLGSYLADCRDFYWTDME